MSVFHHLPLGRRIPDRLHAVSVSLPTMRDLVSYEEKDPAIVRQIASGYPRFVLHPCLRQLTEHLVRQHGLAGRTLWLTASACSAAGLAAHLAATPAGRGARITSFAADDLHGVIHPENPDLFVAAKTFLQNTGMFLGSRVAEDALVRRGILRAVEPEPSFAGDALAEIRRVLRRALPMAGDADLLPACSGMNAIYAAFRAVSELQAARGRTLWVQLGWLYRDTIALLQRFTPDPARDYVHLPDVFDFAALERLFAEKGDRIAGVFAETPTNPLIQTPDVPALAGLDVLLGIVPGSSAVVQDKGHEDTSDGGNHEEGGHCLELQDKTDEDRERDRDDARKHHVLQGAPGRDVNAGGVVRLLRPLEDPPCPGTAGARPG